MLTCRYTFPLCMYPTFHIPLLHLNSSLKTSTYLYFEQSPSHFHDSVIMCSPPLTTAVVNLLVHRWTSVALINIKQHTIDCSLLWFDVVMAELHLAVTELHSGLKPQTSAGIETPQKNRKEWGKRGLLPAGRAKRAECLTIEWLAGGVESVKVQRLENKSPSDAVPHVKRVFGTI